MAIDQTQREYRSRRIGSSDAVRIMAGDWRDVWLEKTGRTAPADLDFVAAVQIGIATEHLHPRFWQRRTGIGSFPARDTAVHPEYGWLVAHPDFLTWREAPLDPFAPPDTILEAKFCGSPKDDSELAEQYYWQIQHQLLVTGLKQAVLSILRPGGYSWVDVPGSAADQALLLETLKAFWWHVETDTEPGDPLPVAAPDLEEQRIVDMSLHNAFAAHAGTLLTCRGNWTAYRQAEAELKSLMPDDVRVAYIALEVSESGAEGLFLSRSRDGRLSLRFGHPPSRHLRRAELWMPPEAAE
ncbi:MAG TPA: YqaJ viral recombinase family protein [Azospirillaceae bacterium]|nr:YqaJ viral recombinase family protein [Azospirillaceae bacterium]